MSDILLNLDDYEQAAKSRLTTNAFGYYGGGADDEVSLQDNRAAFSRVQLTPRVLVDVTERDTSTKLLGKTIGAPIVIAPMAIMRMAHKDAEPAVARVAGARGLPLALSTLASTSMETVAETATGPLWFQLYVYKDRAITEDIVARAEAAGYEALVLTVDVAVAGNRERDVRNRFTMPKGIHLENVAKYALERVEAAEDDSAIAAYAVSQLDPSLTWEDIDWLASITSLPIIVKGILRPDDAVRALDHGAAGLVVSNHGGRQLDTVPAAIDALPSIVSAVGMRGTILMDGGVRRGTDILKALALGADAVMLGRPVLWGLAVNGEDGAAHVLDILIEEFDRAMALSGSPTVARITEDLIFKPHSS
ncbi:MAG: alpha-hydroxy acid oxidase [Chloroflexota bacterium]